MSDEFLMLTPSSTATLNEMAQECLGHLDYEQQTLQQVREMLEQLQTAILSADVPRLAEQVDRQLTFQESLRELQRHRQTLRRRLAQVLSTDDSATCISRLAELTPTETRQALLHKRAQVGSVLDEVERLMMRIAVLSRNGMEVLGRILGGLTGQPASADRYTRLGQRDSQACHGILRARC
jgi:cysteinyl-tRNA synthetase